MAKDSYDGFIDKWAILHLLAGLFIGLILHLFFPFTLATTSFFFVIILIVWELFKNLIIKKFILPKAKKEDMINAMADVLWGMSGFVIAHSIIMFVRLMA